MYALPYVIYESRLAGERRTWHLTRPRVRRPTRISAAYGPPMISLSARCTTAHLQAASAVRHQLVERPLGTTAFASPVAIVWGPSLYPSPLQLFPHPLHTLFWYRHRPSHPRAETKSRTEMTRWPSPDLRLLGALRSRDARTSNCRIVRAFLLSVAVPSDASDPQTLPRYLAEAQGEELKERDSRGDTADDDGVDVLAPHRRRFLRHRRCRHQPQDSWLLLRRLWCLQRPQPRLHPTTSSSPPPLHHYTPTTSYTSNNSAINFSCPRVRVVAPCTVQMPARTVAFRGTFKVRDISSFRFHHRC